MSTRISLAYENSIYMEMCVVMMTLLTGFQLCIFFFNKEIILVEFVLYLKKKKGHIISPALKLHNPSHNRLSLQEPHRLEKETHYGAPLKGAFVRDGGGAANPDQSASSAGLDTIQTDCTQLAVTRTHVQPFSKYVDLFIKR